MADYVYIYIYMAGAQPSMVEGYMRSEDVEKGLLL